MEDPRIAERNNNFKKSIFPTSKDDYIQSLRIECKANLFDLKRLKAVTKGKKENYHNLLKKIIPDLKNLSIDNIVKALLDYLQNDIDYIYLNAILKYLSKLSTEQNGIFISLIQNFNSFSYFINLLKFSEEELHVI